MPANLHFREAQHTAKGFKTGVSLHSHTCHSKETLDFVYRYARESGLLNWAIRRGERQYEKRKGAQLDFGKAYWTPPMAPKEAWELEASQIRNYGLQPIVSITDHDNVDAPLSLNGMPGFCEVPVSLEWTVPYRGTFFHLGLHNLPANEVGRYMAELKAFTQTPVERTLDNLLPAIARNPGTLVVFNHPCWDEKCIGEKLHRFAATQFMAAYGEYVHAVELNGLRPWKENRNVLDFSKEVDKPLISGGDRHGLEPNTILNFTNAVNFEEFVAEVRAGYSEVVLMPSYGHAFRLRLLRDLQDILSHLPEHGLGWQRWDQRVFFECKDKEVRSLATLFGDNVPMPVQVFTKVVLGLKHPRYGSLVEAMWGQDDVVDPGQDPVRPRRFPFRRASANS